MPRSGTSPRRRLTEHQNRARITIATPILPLRGAKVGLVLVDYSCLRHSAARHRIVTARFRLRFSLPSDRACEWACSCLGVSGSTLPTQHPQTVGHLIAASW